MHTHTHTHVDAYVPRERRGREDVIKIEEQHARRTEIQGRGGTTVEHLAVLLEGTFAAGVRSSIRVVRLYGFGSRV